jgi:hypothetical protein
MAEGPFSEIGDWRMENEENFFSSMGEEWRMEKTSCGRFYYFHMGLLLSLGIHTTKSA